MDRIRSRAGALAAAVSRHDETQAAEIRRLGGELEERFLSRRLRVTQAAMHPPQRLNLDRGGRVLLSEGWYSGEESGCEFLAPEARDVHRVWSLRSDQGTEASWRQTVWLTPGSYRFSAIIRTTDVVAASAGALRGAGLRLVGREVQSRSWIRGTRSARARHVDFEADGAVTLAMELRAPVRRSVL